MEQLKEQIDNTKKKKQKQAAEGKREVTEPYGAEGETTTQSRNVGNQVSSGIASHHRRTGV